MAQITLDYAAMVDAALRGVLRRALTVIAERGLPGAHHIFITFRTGAPGVTLPPHLAGQYPNEMTIIVQHQFWGLEVEDERFHITLSFSGANERLTIPFAAVSAFVDPSVQFGLQFRPDEAAPAAPEVTVAAKPAPATPDQKRPEGAAKIVALDKFRKK